MIQRNIAFSHVGNRLPFHPISGIDHPPTHPSHAPDPRAPNDDNTLLPLPATLTCPAYLQDYGESCSQMHTEMELIQKHR
jgi:hypothetical protein